MNANATAISLNLDQVKLILQDWLNANLLRTPHQVLDLDFVGDRLADVQVGQFNIILAPIALAPVVATGNGKEVTPPAQPAAAPKKRTATRQRIPDSVRSQIVILRQQGQRPKALAEQFGISEATVYDIMAEHRRTAGAAAHAN